MYPYPIIGSIDLYTILIAVGIIACFITFRVVSDRLKMNSRIFNFALLCGVLAILTGLFTSIFTQALFNISKIGKFVIDENTGATFAGGLLGGAGGFLLIYFIFGRLVHSDFVSEFRKILKGAACSIPVAHAFGRLGCLMAGCCYGKPTGAFFGIYMVNLGQKVIPTQLFESVFLFVLAAFLIFYTVKGHPYSMSIYMISYGCWRIFIEFFRGDDRGSALTGVLSPAQELCILLIAGGIVLHFAYEKRETKKINEK